MWALASFRHLWRLRLPVSRARCGLRVLRAKQVLSSVREQGPRTVNLPSLQSLVERSSIPRVKSHRQTCRIQISTGSAAPRAFPQARGRKVEAIRHHNMITGAFMMTNFTGMKLRVREGKIDAPAPSASVNRARGGQLFTRATSVARDQHAR